MKESKRSSEMAASVKSCTFSLFSFVNTTIGMTCCSAIIVWRSSHSPLRALGIINSHGGNTTQSSMLLSRRTYSILIPVIFILYHLANRDIKLWCIERWCPSFLVTLPWWRGNYLQPEKSGISGKNGYNSLLLELWAVQNMKETNAKITTGVGYWRWLFCVGRMHKTSNFTFS